MRASLVLFVFAALCLCGSASAVRVHSSSRSLSPVVPTLPAMSERLEMITADDTLASEALDAEMPSLMEINSEADSDSVSYSDEMVDVGLDNDLDNTAEADAEAAAALQSAIGNEDESPDADLNPNAIFAPKITGRHNELNDGVSQENVRIERRAAPQHASHVSAMKSLFDTIADRTPQAAAAVDSDVEKYLTRVF